MGTDRRPEVREPYPGVYMVQLPGSGDAVLVDRARATAEWIAVADLVVEPPRRGPGNTVHQAAQVYRRRRGAEVSPTAPPHEHA